jgi:hypothetical protein
LAHCSRLAPATPSRKRQCGGTGILACLFLFFRRSEATDRQEYLSHYCFAATGFAAGLVSSAFTRAAGRLDAAPAHTGHPEKLPRQASSVASSQPRFA